MEQLNTTCLVVGGGPAGMMAGLLLARVGVRVTVLEKHADFLRDFRGDTVHPSTMELLDEMGLLQDFLRCPHQPVRQVGVNIGGRFFPLADFAGLRTPAPFIAMMPQWDFLEFLARAASRLPGFSLQRRTEVTGLIEQNGRVVGVTTRGEQGEVEMRADLVIAADGRHSILRQHAGLPVQELPAAIDVLWMRLPRSEQDPPQVFGFIGAGRMMVLLDRGDYWQCAYLIPKGHAERVQAQGMELFRRGIASLIPFARDRVDTLESWDQVKLLSVRVDRLREWSRPGLLCIGDAAHAMSPVGGVGINLAIQDAAAASNVLAKALREGRPTDALLLKVQKRRMFSVRTIQRLQLEIHRNVIEPALRSTQPIALPLPIRLVSWIPMLRTLPAWMIGLGPRREHVPRSG